MGGAEVLECTATTHRATARPLQVHRTAVARDHVGDRSRQAHLGRRRRPSTSPRTAREHALLPDHYADRLDASLRRQRSRPTATARAGPCRVRSTCTPRWSAARWRDVIVDGLREAATAKGCPRPLARRVAREAVEGRLPRHAAREAAVEAPLRRGRHLGLCTGCAGCVIACPHDVLGYNDTRASTSRSRSRTAAGPTTAATARRAARRAPGPARASGPGSPRSTSSCSAAPASAEELVGRLQGHRARPGDRPGARTRSARTAGSCRRSSCTRSRRTSSTPRS